MIVHTILIFGLGWGFWMIYEVIKYTQGERIKKYYGRYMALQESRKLEKELREYRLLKLLEANRVIEVEAEPVEWDEVFYRDERPKRTSNIILEINANQIE